MPVSHDIVHHIEKLGPPVSAHPRRLAPDRLKAAKKEFEHPRDYLPFFHCLHGLTWCPRKLPVTGVPVVTTAPSTV